jgi:glycogen synthase
MLAGGGPVITTSTGGTIEAVGDTAIIVEPGDITDLAAAIDHVVLEMPADQRQALESQARAHAMSFDQVKVFDDLFPTPDIPSSDTAA